MAQKLVQINFHYAIPKQQLQAGTDEALALIQQAPGLIWKIWIYNDQDKIAGGIYLFENEDTARAYANGPVVASLKNSPVFSDFNVRLFDIMREQSQATHAYLGGSFPH
ncbi:MAG: YdhR family protein [Pseudomonadales bacterium]|nr:YdhR family protein [Pseudomonadales bacterium]MCP5216014.1 YdhR family protein [Pseudomonadales bacterium]